MSGGATASPPIQKFVLPDGFVIPVPDGKDPRRVWAMHAFAAVSEGKCPIHRITLSEPLEGDERPYCKACERWWWARCEGDDAEVGWELIMECVGTEAKTSRTRRPPRAALAGHPRGGNLDVEGFLTLIEVTSQPALIRPAVQRTFSITAVHATPVHRSWRQHEGRKQFAA